MADSSSAIHFATLLRPYRSLPPTGFKWLIRVVVAANLMIGLPAYFMGAWPVMGFMGLDIALLWWLFQRNYFDARRSEALTLTDSELIIDRVAPDGEREEVRLDAYWLKLERTEERLVASSRGNRVVLGRFLGPDERERVGQELEAAIARMKAPRFVHRWDREDEGA
ncbi:Uncharacterized membrane protein [Enhydrobacter aerosaccus]|uniref:Uncharacterized membrane protein n=1 Tax=Enhydrobacter aerosaccus TaxID=225324 RepID=A0A1T4QJ87_9HYPH|nr:DUF2244 domain-containing protein [Enhydrobacter aerosaccus]SKA03716.1 Uncharacterized membrane protein [Enhydrobacter aerosaccus]